MLSTQTEKSLAKLLLIFADYEASVEISRQILGNQLGFDAYALFKLVDSEAKGFADSLNIVEYLRRFSIFTSTSEVQRIIYHYDADLNATLNYSEFLKLIISDKNVFLKSSGSTYKSFDPVPSDVEYTFVRLLEKELEFVRNLSESIRELSLRYDFNVLDAFRSLDILRIDNINSESIRKFLIRNFITASEQDILSIVKRLDVNCDYRVTYTEFKNLFTTYSSGYNSTSSVVNYSTFSNLGTNYSPIRTQVYCSPRRCYSPLRSYYSPVKSRTYCSPLRNQSNLESTLRNTRNSPLKTMTSEVLLRSPRRVDSPLRTNSAFNHTLKNDNSLGEINKYGASKYVSYEEELFLNYIKDLIAIESALEANKNEISIKSDFNMEDAFTIFEKYSKGFISESDFKERLNSYFGLFPLSEEISVLFKRYDNEDIGSLSYGDFFNMLAPVTFDFRRLIESRIYPNSSLIGDPFSTSTKYALKDLITNLIAHEQALENSRRKIKNLLSFNTKKIFEQIGGYASNYFSEKDVCTLYNIIMFSLCSI